jgi:peroxiredoxin family protein
MPDKLGILVTSDEHLDHLIGVCRAATAAGKEVAVFLTNRGVLLTQHPDFPQLEGQGRISLCNVNFEYFQLQKPVPVVAEKDFATQMRHAEMIEECDRYLVL